MPSIKLTSDDIAALKAIRVLVTQADRSTPAGEAAYRADLSAMEAALIGIAREAYFSWPSFRLAAELERWRPAYRVVRTRAGYKAFRWLGGRGTYASRAIAACLTEREAEVYRVLIRC